MPHLYDSSLCCATDQMALHNILPRFKFLVLQVLGAARLPPALIQSPRYPRVGSQLTFIARNLSLLTLPRPWLSIDIGCGSTPANPFKANLSKGVDILGTDNIHILSADLSRDPIPFPDSSAHIITALDFLEHLPRYSIKNNDACFPVVEIFNEIHRVLIPGGIFFSRTPCFPYKQAYTDPTHVNVMTEDTIPLYFCVNNGSLARPWAEMYGFTGSFLLLDQAWCGSHLLTIIIKH